MRLVRSWLWVAVLGTVTCTALDTADQDTRNSHFISSSDSFSDASYAISHDKRSGASDGFVNSSQSDIFSDTSYATSNDDKSGTSYVSSETIDDKRSGTSDDIRNSGISYATNDDDNNSDGISSDPSYANSDTSYVSSDTGYANSDTSYVSSDTSYANSGSSYVISDGIGPSIRTIGRINDNQNISMCSDVFSADVPICEKDDDSSFIYRCNEGIGRMVVTTPVQNPVTYSFDIPGDIDIEVMICFEKKDITTEMGDTCKIKIGSSPEFTNEEFLEPSTTVYMPSTEKVILFVDAVIGCNISVYYAAIVPVQETIPISIKSASDTGMISFPDDSSETPLFPGLGYNPQKRIQWDFTLPSSYVLELTVTSLYLGARDVALSRQSTMKSFSGNDFVLVGVGQEAFEGSSEILLYGYTDTETKIRVNSFLAHVVLYSTYHEMYAEGFSMNYTAIQISQPTPTTAAPTSVPPVPQPLPTTTVALNDAQQTGQTTAEMDNSFHIAVANMATEYIKLTELSVENCTNPADKSCTVFPEDVDIIQMTNCVLDVCLDTCASFEFGIRIVTGDGTNWAFTEDILNKMIHEPAIDNKWQAMNEKTEYCEENVTVNWWVIGGSGLVIVAFAVLLSLAAWKIKGKTDQNKNVRDLEEDRKLEELEKRRRSSGELSKIGGVKGFTRTSLPFGRSRASIDSVDSDNNEDFDTADYTEFDSDEDYGIDILPDNQSPASYSNPAFLPDSPTQKKKYQQLQHELLDLEEDTDHNIVNSLPSGATAATIGWTTQGLKSSLKKTKGDGSMLKLRMDASASSTDGNSMHDSEDSDGALRFDEHPSLSRRQVSIEAEVHAEDIEESVL